VFAADMLTEEGLAFAQALFEFEKGKYPTKEQTMRRPGGYLRLVGLILPNQLGKLEGHSEAGRIRAVGSCR
jgi:hypothetical protein